jgi:hypothetical protein
MATFKYCEADTIKVGDIMRQCDENKTHTYFDHYKATSVYIGDLIRPIYDGNGTFIGDRIEKDIVEIEWHPLEKGKPFKMRYVRQARIEIATDANLDPATLLLVEEHQEE